MTFASDGWADNGSASNTAIARVSRVIGESLSSLTLHFAAMSGLQHLFDKNRAWAAEMIRQDPEFFTRLAHQQAPQFLWIGCSDSRVPANQIVGLLPGEMF